VAAVTAVAVIAVGSTAFWLGQRQSGDSEAPTADAAPSAEAIASATTEPEVISTPDSEATEPADEEPVATPPVEPVDVPDPVGDMRYRNVGQQVTDNGDIVSVSLVPARGDDDVDWLVVHFVNNRDPQGGVVANFDVNGDRFPDYISWVNTASGAMGSYAAAGWEHGRDIISSDGSFDAEHFSPGARRAPRGGTAFPITFSADELAGGPLRVNVQVINGESYFDYSPVRHRWSKFRVSERS